MPVLQSMVIVLMMFVVPTIIGTLFLTGYKGKENIIFSWISGQLLLWAGFEVICVPMVLKEQHFGDVVLLFHIFTAVLCIAAILVLVCRKKKLRLVAEKKSLRECITEDKICTCLWVLFGAVLLFQVIQSLRLTYADWDDAYYVAISTVTADADTMYQKLPYTGGATTLDARHGLAPFPIWIAYLSRVSGISAVTVSHMVVPPIFLCMSYGIYSLIGERILGQNNRKMPIFLLFMELLVLFGNYSIYTVENFMIARSRQGKAALGSIIIPILIYILLVILQELEKGKKCTYMIYAVLIVTMISACLCSTMGAMLVCMPVGIVGVCALFSYKKWKPVLLMALCCVPCVAMAGLYLILK